MPRPTTARRPSESLWFSCFLMTLVATACAYPQPPESELSGSISGRVLIAPGVGLANANVVIEQIELYDHGRVPAGEIRHHYLDIPTDANGNFGPVSAKAYAGVFRIRTQGGEYRDPISGSKIRFDPAHELRALHFMRFFGTRTDMNVTPVHTIAEARFQYLVSTGEEPLRAIDHAYADIRQHFGDLDWQHILPAEVDEPTVSPTDAFRAAFLLGGLAVLADDLRLASDATPQVVNIMTLTRAAAQDLAADMTFDGNDGNDATTGSGLQVGLCEPTPPTCQAPPAGCQLGTCRTRCDVYANTFRAGLAAGTRKYMGSKAVPSTWNQTTLGSEDVRLMLAHLATNPVPELFGTACTETSDRVEPTIVWELAPAHGQAVKGTFTLRVRAIDDAEAPPSVKVEGRLDEDGDPTNASATVTLDTRQINGGADGDLVVDVLATDLAGNERRASRTFQVDNTAPVVALDDADFYLDPETGVRWTAASGPVLHGTLSEANVEAVEVLVAGAVAATATIGTGAMTWSAQLPEGRITSAGVEVVIRALDRAGNVTSTAPVLARLDATPPSLLVEPSLVYDERLSREIYEDDAPSNTWVQRHLVQGTPLDLAQSMQGACVTLGKFSHLLGASLPLGAAGSLNPLRLSAVVSDDGVGIAPATTQMRVSVNGSEALPWTPVDGTPIAPMAKRHELPLSREGTLAIPALATTEGVYLVELRAVDRLGRVSSTARCWNHKLLAPKLKLTEGDGAIATGFDLALYSTALGASGPAGNVSGKLLSATPQGAAVWQWRVRNYVAAPIYLTVRILPTDIAVSKSFLVKETLLTSDAGVYESCGTALPPNPPPRCSIVSTALPYTGASSNVEFKDAKFRARLFVGAPGGNLGAELLPCTGCTNNDAEQTYTFEIPARTTPQGSPLPEYVFLTHLRPEAPGFGGATLRTLLAPSDAVSPDAGPFGEFLINNVRLTGRPMTAPSPSLYCSAEEYNGELRQWFCTNKVRKQTYRALTFMQLRWTRDVVTMYSSSATLAIPATAIRSAAIRAETYWNSTTQQPYP